MMYEVRKIDPNKVRRYCIDKNFYCYGTNEEYSELLQKCSYKEVSFDDLQEIAKDIRIHSDMEFERNLTGCSDLEILANIISDLINDCCYSCIKL